MCNCGGLVAQQSKHEQIIIYFAINYFYWRLNQLDFFNSNWRQKCPSLRKRFVRRSETFDQLKPEPGTDPKSLARLTTLLSNQHRTCLKHSWPGLSTILLNKAEKWRTLLSAFSSLTLSHAGSGFESSPFASIRASSGSTPRSVLMTFDADAPLLSSSDFRFRAGGLSTPFIPTDPGRRSRAFWKRATQQGHFLFSQPLFCFSTTRFFQLFAAFFLSFRLFFWERQGWKSN